jgi:drug/metabolite transporter (DMT)-like permease
VSPQLLYLAVPGAVIGVLTWNASIRMIGPQNAVLFGNLIPVTTFAIETVRGYRPGPVELGGAALTIAALVASNLLARRRTAPARRPVTVQRESLAEAA